MMNDPLTTKPLSVICRCAVISLSLLLSLKTVSGDIIVKDVVANKTFSHYADLEAEFGGSFPDKGLPGRLIYVEPRDACKPVRSPRKPIDPPYVWIAMIARGNCTFVEKVWNVQLANFSSAIVHNSPDDDSLVQMGGGLNHSFVTIPATFVGYHTGRTLVEKYSYNHSRYIIVIKEQIQFDYKMYLWPFVVVVGVCFLIVMIFMIIKFIRDQTRSQNRRLSKKHLKKIPVRKYKKGEYYDTCAICLDEYEEGEKIRVLPCDHVYHCKCIDPWLTKNRKVCPVCKRRVIPRDRSAPDSESESGSDTDTQSENTPLLGSGASSSNTRGGNTFALPGGLAPTATTINETESRSMASSPGQASLSSSPGSQAGAVGGVGISDRVEEGDDGTATQHAGLDDEEEKGREEEGEKLEEEEENEQDGDVGAHSNAGFTTDRDVQVPHGAKQELNQVV